MGDLVERHADAYVFDPLPDGLDARQRADAILATPVAGRSPREWIDAARSPALSALGPPRGQPEAGSLDEAVLSAYRAVGVEPSADDLAAARANAEAVDPSLRGAVAGLVATVAQAQDEQADLAAVLRERLDRTGFQAGTPFLAPAERDASAARAAGILAAAQGLAAQSAAGVPPLAAVCLLPVDLTAASLGSGCMAWLGSCGDDLYAPNPAPFPLPDPVLIVEPCGNDTYTTSAGGANPLGLLAPANFLAVSAVIDYEGNDRYTYAGEPSVVQGAGSFGGVGVLFDERGDDVYLADYNRTTPPPLVESNSGNVDAGAQGYGYGGVGLLVDDWGDDVYDFRFAADGYCFWAYAQGIGGGGGLGVAVDLWGNDDWLAIGGGLAPGSSCFVTGDGMALLGIYAQGVGLTGGTGIAVDGGQGNDLWYVYDNATHPDMYGQAWGGLGGVGILYDDGGTDSFVASQTSTVSGISLNCSFGVGQVGVGIMWVGPGATSYLLETFGTATGGADSMGEGWGLGGYGLFIDEDGEDRHVMTVSAGFPTIAGRGQNVLGTSAGAGLGAFGNYLDAGTDDDLYVGPPFFFVPLDGGPGPNNSVWDGGADI
jgi:hypothetical protein